MIERLRVRILAEAAREFSSSELTACANYNSVSVPAPTPTPTPIPTPQPTRVTAGARKDPGHSAKSAAGVHVTPQHAYTLDPTTLECRADYVVQAQCAWNLTGKRATRNSSGDARPQSSQLAEPLWTSPGLKSGIDVHGLISTLKKKTLKIKNYF